MDPSPNPRERQPESSCAAAAAYAVVPYLERSPHSSFSSLLRGTSFQRFPSSPPSSRAGFRRPWAGAFVKTGFFFRGRRWSGKEKRQSSGDQTSFQGHGAAPSLSPGARRHRSSLLTPLCLIYHRPITCGAEHLHDLHPSTAQYWRHMWFGVPPMPSTTHYCQHRFHTWTILTSRLRPFLHPHCTCAPLCSCETLAFRWRQWPPWWSGRWSKS